MDTVLLYESVNSLSYNNGNIQGAIGGLPDVMETVGDVVDTASGAASSLAGTARNIAGGPPIAGPLLQQLLGTVLGHLGAVLGIAHQLPQPAASASMQAST
ncbi:hypothetical protein Aduo_005626 [Ancylostoma duodenale]